MRNQDSSNPYLPSSPERPGSQNGAAEEAQSAAARKREREGREREGRSREGANARSAHAQARTAQPRERKAVAREREGQSAAGRSGVAVAATTAAKEAACGGQEAPESTALDSTQSKCAHTSLTCGNADQAVDGEKPVGATARDRRRLRWNARSALWSASSLKAVRCCGRLLGHGFDEGDFGWVPVKKAGQSAGYGNLSTCGSPWSCPRCSAVIAAERSIEIGNAVRACQSAGGDVAMMTLTLRHDRRDELQRMWEGLSSGWREVFGSKEYTGTRGRWMKRKNGPDSWREGKPGDKERFQIAGTTRVVECTFGRPELGGHGWHLHAHVLIYSATKFADILDRDGVSRLLMLDRPCTDDESRMVAMALLGYRCFSRWQTGVVNTGLPMPEGSGFDLRYVADEGAEFIGNYLAKSTLDVAAKIGAEVAGGRNTKVAKKAGNVTPFEMLDDLTRRDGAPRLGFRTPRRWDWMELPEGGSGVVDLDSGEITEVKAPGEWSRWHEWERASKGRRQILWSLRIKEPTTDRERLWNEILDARGREKTDEEIADTEIKGDVVARIARSGWYGRMVWHPAWLSDLLEVVEDAEDNSAAADAADEWMDDHGVQSVRTVSDAVAAFEPVGATPPF